MFKKIGTIIIGVLIGVVLVGVVWYLIAGWTEEAPVKKEAEIKSDLLSNQAIKTVKERSSAINFPITVSDKETGVKNPF